MLKAIIHGKSGRIESNENESVSWSHLFKTHEDLLTSTIFERFAYLSDDIQHRILNYWFQNHYGTIPMSFGEFIDITYWGRFEHKHDGVVNQVEPDIILHFDTCNILVEVKPPAGGDQYFKQWNKEVESYLQSQDGDHKPLYFLAIGRIEQSNAADWAEKLLSSEFEQLKGVSALKWDVVTAQLIELINQNTELLLSKQDHRIIQDMLDGLSLYGQQITPFNWIDLLHSKLPVLSLSHPQLDKDMDASSSLQSLQNHALGRLDLQQFQSIL